MRAGRGRAQPAPGGEEARALFLRCADGDEEAWGEFQREYGPLVAFLASQVLRRAGPAASQEVDEVAADARAALLADRGRKLRAYDPAYRPSTWLRLVVLSAARDRLRWLGKLPQTAPVEESFLVVPGPGPEQDAQRAEAGARLRDALGSFPARVRLALRWTYVEGLTRQEVARLLRVTEGAVGKILVRAQRRLHSLLRERNPRE